MKGTRMAQWARRPEHRDQMVLFATRLDDAIGPEHPVRLLDEILGHCSWAKWEARYHLRLGQPPIHPRVLASIVLYGVMKRVRTSRALEAALRERIDFRWLAHGFQIDHSTLSVFRTKNSDQLKDLFRRVGQLARQLEFLSLQRVCFDGTRIRANSRRGSTRTPAELREEKEQLEKKYDDYVQQAKAEEARDQELSVAEGEAALPDELRDVKNRLARVAGAIEELEQLEQAGATIPKRIPLTDPESRVMPNKEGGYAPNYTPIATVDQASGIIVAVEVLNVHNEDPHLVPSLRQVQENFELPTLPPEVLTDGLNATGANLALCEELGVTLYAPVPLPDPANPALRADPTQPVPEAEWDGLPMHNTKDGPRLDKAAFVFCAAENCYHCPLGKALPFIGSTSEANGTGHRIRDRYQASKSDCDACPLRGRCLHGKGQQRQVVREQYEPHRERQAQRMSLSEAKAIYALRRHPGERPFAMIKHAFGMRQFLLRGLDKVRTEFRWAAVAFNLQRIMSLLRSRAGPDGKIILPTP